MEITHSNAVTTTSQSAAVANESAKSVVSSDFETFLKMLTVQLENQDPLNPVNSADYAVQLATFSSVEQQVKTNELLESMVSQMRLSDMSALAGWVGMEARVEGPVSFDGSPVTLSLDQNSSADNAFLVVTDQAGNEVQRIQVGSSDTTITWAGVGDAGEPLASGTYNFHLQSYKNDEVVSDDPVRSYGRIVEAKSELGTTMLVLENGTEVAADKVSALRIAE